MALNFSGSSYLTYNAALVNWAAATELSYMIWFRTSSISKQYLFSQKNSGTAASIAIFIVSGNVNAECVTNDIDLSFPIAAGNANNVWHHAVVSRNAAGLWSFYVDAVLVGTATATGSDAAITTTNQEIGHDFLLGFFMIGDLSDYRIYNRQLSIAEIKTIYKTLGVDGIEYGLTRRWPMKEKNLATVPGANTVLDISGERAIATPVGSPTYSADMNRLRRRLA